MANLASNPWTVLPADVVVSSPTALSVNTDGSVNLTTTAPFAGATVGIGVTLINNTPTAYNGFYRILRVTSPTVFVLTPYNNIPLTTGVGTIFGTAAKNLYNAHIRVRWMNWENSTVGNILELRDRNGNLVWKATSTVTGEQKFTKTAWIFGLTPISLPTGEVFITVG